MQTGSKYIDRCYVSSSLGDCLQTVTDLFGLTREKGNITSQGTRDMLEKLGCKQLPATITLPRDTRNGNVRVM